MLGNLSQTKPCSTIIVPPQQPTFIKRLSRCLHTFYKVLWLYVVLVIGRNVKVSKILFTIFSKNGVNDEKKCDGFINVTDEDEIKVMVVSWGMAVVTLGRLRYRHNMELGAWRRGL